jgi:HK97 family phage major capsid protein
MAVPIVRPGFGTTLMEREVSDFIFERALRESAVMQLARETPLLVTGKAIPVVTGKPAAGWVSEAGRKPVSDATVGTKTMDPKKLAVVVPFSKEYLRDDTIDLEGMLRPMIAETFATAFDAACLQGTSTPFSGYIYQTSNAVEIGTSPVAEGGVYKDFVNGLSRVIDENQGYRVNGWALDDIAEPILLGAVDTTGRPLFVQDVSADGAQPVGRILGRPAMYTAKISTPIVTGTPNTGGVRAIGGDWTQAVFGVAEEISYDISTEATIVLADGTTQLHLWQENLVALLAEAEFGFLVNDAQAFVRITDNT